MRILIATGGTGGHIFPAIKVAQEMRARNHDVSFAGVLGMAEDQIISAGFDLVNLKVKGFNPHSIIGVVQFFWLMLLAIGRSIALIKRLNPDKVIGFGGYGSFPIITAAWLLGKFIVIHEQNVYPGKANRIMARMAQRIAISFNDSSSYLPKAKLTLTGCPCNAQRATKEKHIILKDFGLDPYKPTIMLLGGSQGSQKLNEVFAQFVASQPHHGAWQAIHMTGKLEYDKYVRYYAAQQLPVVALAFISNVVDAYAVSDVVIARAGASTVNELGLLGIPSILVPYPFAGGHQFYNARVLERLGLAQIIKQEELTMDKLSSALRKSYEIRSQLPLLKNVIAAEIKSEAAKAIADIIECKTL